MPKKFYAITTILLCCFTSTIFSQKKIVVNGVLTGVEEGTRIFLMKEEGSVGTSVAKDSVINGRFHIEYTPETEDTEPYSLMADGKGFPSMSLKLWGKAGHPIFVAGNKKLIYTWNVKSDIPEQKEWAYFINANRQLWNEDQALSVQRSALIDKYYADNLTKDEKKNLKSSIDSLDSLSNIKSYKIYKNNLAILQRGKMTTTRVMILNSAAKTMKWNKIEEFRPTVENLYSKLHPDYKNSVDGQEIALILFPPKIVKTGEYMYDTLLNDLNNKSYHLADFKGKYVLLDFWSFGCGPCHASIPEMKEIHEKLKDSLAIVSLSSDNRKMWEKATEMFKMTWNNLSDGNETRGIYAKYGVSGIPNYVLIAPDGIIKAMWTGYGTGSLKQKIKELTGLSISDTAKN